jgi:hypothetical protein
MMEASISTGKAPSPDGYSGQLYWPWILGRSGAAIRGRFSDLIFVLFLLGVA